MSTYTIGEVAGRSGFSASALRYYEGIGLVPPSARTTSGYRVYDDRTLDRLAFIARAKQLGCSLDEITDLVAIWDGERCGPVQHRLHELVTDKIDTARRQLSELAAFTRQLETAAAQLSAIPTDGPCGDGCACLAVTTIAATDASTPIVLSAKPSDAAIACTLDSGAMPDRLASWRRVLDRAGTRTALPDGTLRVELGADVELAHLAELVAAEQACCSFFSFAITVDSRGVALEVSAPEGAAEIVASLFGEAV